MKRYLKYLLKNRAISLILSRAYRPILSVSRFTILVFDGSLRRTIGMVIISHLAFLRQQWDIG